MSADADLIRGWMEQATSLRERIEADAARRREWAAEDERARAGLKGGGGGRGSAPRNRAGRSAAPIPGNGPTQTVGRGASGGAGFDGPRVSEPSGGLPGSAAGGFGGSSGGGTSPRPGGRGGGFGGGGGSRPHGGRGSADLVAQGYAPAVVKVVSYATGGTRAKATALYVAREGVEIETRDGRVLADRAAVNAEVDGWSQRFGRREPTQDVMGVQVQIAGLRADRAEDRGALMRAVATGFAGHRHAWQLETGPDGSLQAHVVAAAAGEGRERFRVTSERIGEAENGFGRRILDAPSEARIKARMTEATGIGSHRVTLVPSAPGHGIEGVRHHLDRMTKRAPAQDEKGRRLTTMADAQETARGWQRDLRSQQARDTMHLVMSARVGTDPAALRDAVRSFLSDRFADHAYLFGVHTDKEAAGHIHAHAVIAVRDDGGRKMQPGPREFRQWRESYAEHTQAQGLRIVATTAMERASSQSYGARDKSIVAAADRPRPQREARDWAYASRPGNREMIANARQRIETARSNPVRVPRGPAAIAAAGEAAQRWAVLAGEQPSNALAAHYARRTKEAYRLADSTHARQIETAVPIRPEPEQKEKPMAVTAAKMEADLKRMNEQAAATAATLDGPARERYEELTTSILHTSAIRLDLQRMMEKGQTHIDLETVRAMLPPDKADAIIAQMRAQKAKEQDRAPGAPPANDAIASNDNPAARPPTRDQAEVDRVAAREEREAEAAERLERLAHEIERAYASRATRTPESGRQLDADRGVSRQAERLAQRERAEAEAADRSAGQGQTAATPPTGPQVEDRDRERQRVFDEVRAEHEARRRAEQSRDEQEM